MTEYSFDRDDYHHDQRDDERRNDPRDNDPYWGMERERDRDNDYEGQQSVGYVAVTQRRTAYFAIAPMNRRRKKTRDLSWYFV